MKKHLLFAVAAGALLTLNACGGTAAKNSTTSVSPGEVPNHFVVAAPSDAASGTSFIFPVTAVDAAGNVVSTYTGVAHFTSTDSLAALPPDSGITNAMGTFSATMATVGTQNVTATDVSTALTGTSSSIDVLAAGTFVIISGQPPDGVVGEPYGGFHQVCVTGMIEGFELEAFGTTEGKQADRGAGGATWSSSALPPGMQISSVTLGGPPICPQGTVWVIDGDPTTAGDYTFAITANYSGATTGATYTIKIENP